MLGTWINFRLADMLIEILAQIGQTKWASLSATRFTLTVDSFMSVNFFQI
jgi:hypothetical protein